MTKEPHPKRDGKVCCPHCDGPRYRKVGHRRLRKMVKTWLRQEIQRG